jgi:hypothetical protein
MQPPSPRETACSPVLPVARGPISDHVIAMLAEAGSSPPPDWLDDVDIADFLSDDDFQLALYVLYELHYRSFAGVEDGLEWDPGVLAVRAMLEAQFESALRARVTPSRSRVDAVTAVQQAVDAAAGPSLSKYMSTRGTLEQMREFAIHRSAYQLKEADPHTWALPRLDGRAKAALAAIQFDEYGGGEQAEMHSELFVDTLRELGLDPTYGAYLDLLPGSTLATVNLVTMFGLHRRLRGALVGHLAVFEMTSVTPMQRYRDALLRLGAANAACRFYDAHVIADEWHQEIALHQLVAGLVDQDPSLADDVVFGARSVLLVEANFAKGLLDSWEVNRSSLLAPQRVRSVA